eukprot:GDKJ01034811.1.p1 GENE.GDKJ01034811.1~~GDKJ01034811.1.p1  ORF type:complete len:212 (+),score=38.07 GDKJ01034811.1:28-663(+)
MKVVLFGSTGRTGALLIPKLVSAGHDVVCYARNPEKISTGDKVSVVKGDLTDKSLIESTIKGADAVVSTLGNPSVLSRDETLAVGIENVVSGMKATDVKRIIYMSSMGCNESRAQFGQLGPLSRFFICDMFLRFPLQVHTKCENMIKGANLDYTFIRPGKLTENMTTTTRFGIDLPAPWWPPRVSRNAVAELIAKQVDSREFVKKALWCYE